MPDATITSTASTFGTISGTFSADQSTVTGTISGVITGTLTGSVGVPGPAGPAGIGLPAGGTSGQFLQKTSGSDYATDWVTVNLAAYAVKANNLSDLTNFSTARSNLGLGTMATATATDYLSKAGNLSGLANAETARDNLALGKGNTVYFNYVKAQNLSETQVTSINPAGIDVYDSSFGSFNIRPSNGLKYPDNTVQTTAFTTSLLTPYLLSSTASSTYQTLAGMSSYLTTSAAAAGYYPLSGNPSGFLTAASLSGYATESWVTAGFAPLAAGLPAGGEDGQIIVKDGTVDYATIWTDNSAEALTVRATNKTGSTLNKGAVVRINGAQGQRPTIALAQANSGASADGVIGILLATLANNATGLVCTAGLAKRLDTSAYSEGVKLFLSPSVAGGLTPTRPSAPDHAVAVGIVSHSSATTGSIEVNVVVGDHLEWLHDVLITTPTNGQVLKYDSATSLWKNQTDAVGAVTSVAGRTGAVVLSNTDISGLGTMATATASDYSTTTVANGLYYPLSGNPSSFLVAADIAGKADIASPALTGNVTITTNSTSPALFIQQAGTGNILTLHDQAADTTFVAIDQNGKIATIPSTTANAGFNVPHATAAPTAPVNGDVWTTTSGLFTRINGGTRQFATLSDGQSFSGNNTFTGPTLTFGNTTAASTVNIGTGATLTATTKAVNIGTNGVAGSTTNIAIGSTTGTTNTSLHGTINATASIAADTNSTIVATTAFVVGQAGSASPLVNGTAAAGTSLRYARQDHVHPTDTTRAPLASPALTGTPTSTTAAADTNTTQIATTAFVVGQAGSATPLVNGTAAVGTSLRFARQDHVHGTDTTRAALASPTFTGVPAAPTAAVDTNTTQLATTAYVVGQAAAATPLVNGTAAVGTSLRYARADHVHPTDTTRAPLASPALTGTPTAPTATAGTNTTQLATTAFVTAAVPAFATTAEINSPASTTKVVAPFDVVRMITNRAVFDTQASSPIFSTSGTGAEGYKQSSDRQLGIGTPNAGIAGWGQLIYETQTGGWGLLGAKRGATMQTQDWNKRIYMTGSTVFISMGDANTTARLMLGGRTSATSGSPTKQSIGWRLTGGGSNPLVLVTYGWNGSALVVTETTSTFTPVLNQTFDWAIYHAPNVANPATSFCYLYVNDVLVATGINSPADATVTNNYFVQTCESTSSIATRMAAFILPTKIWWSKS